MPPLLSKLTFCKLDSDGIEDNDRGAFTASENMAAKKRNKRSIKDPLIVPKGLVKASSITKMEDDNSLPQGAKKEHALNKQRRLTFVGDERL